MSAFDAELNVMDVVATAPSEDDRAAGAFPGVLVQLAVGLPLPFSPGPGQPALQVPVATLRFFLSKANAEAVGAAAADLPDDKKPSGLTIASNLSQAAQVAKDLGGIK